MKSEHEDSQKLLLIDSTPILLKIYSRRLTLFDTPLVPPFLAGMKRGGGGACILIPIEDVDLCVTF